MGKITFKRGRWLVLAFLTGAWQLLPQHTIHRGFLQENRGAMKALGIRINGEDVHYVDSGREWVVIRGDTLEAVEGLWVSPRKAFPIKQEFLTETPSNFWDTKKPIPLERSLDAQGKVGVLVAWGPKGSCEGWVALRLEEPSLRYVDVRINGRLRVLRLGDKLSLRTHDVFQLVRVVTNLGSLKDVEISKKKLPPPLDLWEHEVRKDLTGSPYWLEFSYKKSVFAKILMTVHES